MSKAHERPRNARSRTAGRTGLGLALAATTAVGVTVPTAAQAAPTGHQPATHHATALPAAHGAALATAPAPSTRALPAAPAMTYRVQAGDTVSHIAARTGTSVAAIIRANNLDSRALIRIGQKLTIPSPGASSAVKATTGSASPTPSSGTHTVQAGDTVSGLAKRHGTSVAAIIQANNLDSRALIRIGQKLTIPSAGASPTSNEKLVPDTFLGRTYPGSTVAAANANKASLLATSVPSRAEMQRVVAQVARQMGVDPALAQAHAYQESGFNHASVSPANAIGTMQVIPSSGDWASGLVGRDLDLLDPYDNVVAGVAIIRQLARTFPGNQDHAIAAYYQGAGAVKRNGLYPDTQRYVASVKAHMASFRG